MNPMIIPGIVGMHIIYLLVMFLNFPQVVKNQFLRVIR